MAVVLGRLSLGSLSRQPCGWAASLGSRAAGQLCLGTVSLAAVFAMQPPGRVSLCRQTCRWASAQACALCTFFFKRGTSPFKRGTSSVSPAGDALPFGVKSPWMPTACCPPRAFQRNGALAELRLLGLVRYRSGMESIRTVEHRHVVRRPPFDRCGTSRSAVRAAIAL